MREICISYPYERKRIAPVVGFAVDLGFGGVNLKRFSFDKTAGNDRLGGDGLLPV